MTGNWVFTDKSHDILCNASNCSHLEDNKETCWLEYNFGFVSTVNGDFGHDVMQYHVVEM